MKKLFTLFAMLTLLVSLNAQTINYQAVLRDTTNKNELLRNQEVNAEFYVLVTDASGRDFQLMKDTLLVTNADGMINFPIDFSAADGKLDWRNNKILAIFRYGESDSIVLETPVTAVPYAIQAKDGILTTSVITNYINSTAGGEQADFNSVWNAVMRNEQLRKDINDSIVEFLKQKENYEIAKNIIYGYLSQVSSADVREAYNLARSVDTATKDTIIFVMKDFVNTHHKLVIEALEYYAQTATEEEMRSIYETLKTRVGTTVKDLMYQYFNHYMKTKGLVCEGKNLCDAIAAMNAGGSTPAGLTYLTVKPSPSSSSAQTQRFYYMPDDTYGQALARDENKNLGWSSYHHDNNEYITIYIQDFGDLYVNGDSDFMEGSGHVYPTSNNFDVKLGTHVSPNDNLIFGDGH